MKPGTEVTLPMRVFITGGTGMIGRRLVQRLKGRGDTPVILSRKPDETRRNPAIRGIQVIGGDPSDPGDWQHAVDGCDAVVNLAGQNVFGHRWTSEIKRQIRDSRVYGAEHVVEAIAKARDRPKVLIQGSAIGYYGATGDEELTEASPPGSDFLAVVCRELEQAAWAAEGMGLRLATIRTGVVLGKGEGALGTMVPLFKIPGGAAPVGNGGHAFRLARGLQWLSWIHIDDIVNLFLLALDHPGARGPINGTAPSPARNVDFSRSLAKALRRPFLPFGPPDLALRAMLGEVANVVTTGQRVVPARALALGYHFEHPELDEAIRSALKPPKAAPSPEPLSASSTTHH